MNNVGIDVTPPKITCEDSMCPFHGSLKVRGKLIKGRVASIKAQGSSVIEREYLQLIKKYHRYEKRRSRTSAHLPPCIEITEGDVVTIGECRPLSKEISFVVLGKVE